MAMLRVAGGVFLCAILLVFAWPCSATEFSWTGALQLDERSGAVALEAGRVSKVVGSEACALDQQTNVAVTLETSAPGAKQQSESSADAVLTASVTDACGGAALVTLGLLKVDKSGAVATWIGTASWAGVRCKNASAGLSVRVSLSAPSVLKSVTLLKCAISTVCVSGAANSMETFAAQKSEAAGAATNAIGISAHHSRVRRAVCSGTVSQMVTSTPFVFGSNIGVPEYNPNMFCTWEFVAPQGAVIFLRFTAFSTEACCDLIFVHNGNVNDPIFPGGQYGGDTIPGPFMSSNNSMRVDFQTDNDDQSTGFVAEATSRFICTQDSNLNITLDNTIIATGAPGAGYSTPLACTWTLTAPAHKRAKISFSSFSTQDTLLVYEGNSNFLIGLFSGGALPPPIVSTGNSLTLVFEANSANESLVSTGFEGLFTFTTDPPSELSPCISSPNPVANGNVTDCCLTPSGVTCAPQCDPGFVPKGEYTCYGNIWSGAANCSASPCFSAPMIDHGEAQHCAGLSSGQICIPNCDQGCTRSGQFTCSFGTWMGQASCAVNPCTSVPPPVMYGNVEGCTNVGSGRTCDPVCEKGYSLNSTYLCNATRWTGEPTCQANPCTSAAPSVAHGSTLGCVGTKSAADCAPTCESGYTLAGQFLCTTGVWSGSAFCLQNPCNSTPAAVANGNVSSCSGLPSGSSCEPVCDADYSPIGQYLCYAGSWAGTPVCQANPCNSMPPAVANGDVSTCTGLTSGSTCEPNCDNDYTPRGEYLCSKGVWAGTPACQVNTAPQASANSNEWGISSATLWLAVALSVLVLGILILFVIRRARGSNKSRPRVTPVPLLPDDDDELLN